MEKTIEELENDIDELLCKSYKYTSNERFSQERFYKDIAYKKIAEYILKDRNKLIDIFVQRCEEEIHLELFYIYDRLNDQEYQQYNDGGKAIKECANLAYKALKQIAEELKSEIKGK